MGRFSLNVMMVPLNTHLGWLDVVARMTIKKLFGLSSTKVKHNSATAGITLSLLIMIR